MPKAWWVLVDKSGRKHPFIVALSDLTEAEVAAVNKAGGGDAIIRASVSDENYEKLGLATGDVIGGPHSWVD